MAANKRRILRADQGQVPHRNKEIVSFVVLLTRGVLVLLLVKRVVICQRQDHFARVCRKKLENLGGKTVHAMAEEPDDSDTGADLFTFSVE